MHMIVIVIVVVMVVFVFDQRFARRRTDVDGVIEPVLKDLNINVVVVVIVIVVMMIVVFTKAGPDVALTKAHAINPQHRRRAQSVLRRQQMRVRDKLLIGFVVELRNDCAATAVHVARRAAVRLALRDGVVFGAHHNNVADAKRRIARSAHLAAVSAEQRIQLVDAPHATIDAKVEDRCLFV